MLALPYPITLLPGRGFGRRLEYSVRGAGYPSVPVKNKPAQDKGRVAARGTTLIGAVRKNTGRPLGPCDASQTASAQ
jgi:hypothetical protein